MRRWSGLGDRADWLPAMLLVLLMVSGLAFAAPASGAESAGRVPRPVIERGTGEKCVEDTAFMRRNHMTLLKHQRDQTVHDGIRTKQYSLNGCIECHASRKTGSVGSVIGSDQNFCQACHSYAAVQLDCFECHASKPKPTASAMGTLGQGIAPGAGSAPIAQPSSGPAAGSMPMATTR